MIQIPYVADTVSDLQGLVYQDGVTYKLLGNSNKFDQPATWYTYDSSSTATADGVNIIQPTAITGTNPGRYVKRADSYNGLTNTPTLATVATSGAYADLSGKPVIPAAQVNSDWNASSGITQIVNKPSLAAVATSGNYGDLTARPSIPAAQVNSDWNATSGITQIQNKPTLATVATSGNYTDLAGKPTIPAAQVNSDWNALSGSAQILNKPSLATVAVSGNYSDLSGKPTIPAAQQAYEGTTLRTNSFPVFMDASVSSGTAVFNLTTNGISTGTAIFPNGVIQDSLNLFVSDATAAYQMSSVFSNSNKTITVTANKLTTASLLTGILGQAPANGAVVKLQIWGY